MSEGDPRLFVGAVSASIAAHVVVAVLLIVAPSALPPDDALSVRPEITIEVIEDEPIPEEVVPEPIPEPEVVPEPETTPPETDARPEPPDRAAPPDPAAVVSPSAIATVTPPSEQQPLAPTLEDRPPPTETPEERRERLRILMDPRAVARSSFTIEGPGPSQRRGPQTAGPVDTGPTEQELEQELSGSLRRQAMAKAHITHEDFRIVPRPDGTHVFTGHAFTATIQPDGSVSFSDRPGIETEGFTLNGSFDLGDAIMRGAGQDPYSAERERFMEEAEPIIARLEAEWMREHMGDAIRRLPGRLAGFWAADRRTPEQRRARIFREWEETDDGEQGLEARRAIEAWVRTTLPAGSEDAYPPEELRELNASHDHPYRFNPYR